MAEHSRSSGVFSRRRVEDVCCRPPARPRRYPVQSSLSGEREMTPRDRPLCRATVGGPLSRPPPQTRIEVCASLVHCQKIGANRVPSQRMQRKRRPRFLPALSLPAKTCRCKSGQGPGCISRIFFLHNHLHCLSQHLLLLLPDHYLPLFCNRQKCPFRLIIFLCRPFAWSAPLLVIISPFFATVKNYQPNLIMHTFIVWRDLHLSHCSKQGVPFKMCGSLLLIR